MAVGRKLYWDSGKGVVEAWRIVDWVVMLTGGKVEEEEEEEEGGGGREA